MDVDVNFEITISNRRRVTVNFPQPEFFATDDDKKNFTCTLKFQQFPVHVNNATTGHKLQGTSMEALMISSWSHCGNWPCVMLSRVRTLEGLFLREPLKHQGGKNGKDCSAPPELVKMLEFFEKTKTPSAFGDEFDEKRIFDASEDLQHQFHDYFSPF